MKKIIIGVITLLFATACSKDENSASKNGYLLLYEIDYISNTFKGGKEYRYSSCVDTDTIPVKATYISPCDFGELAISYEPFKDQDAVDTIFKGIIKWQHFGEIEIPEAFESANSFELVSNVPNAIPSKSQFQIIHIDEACIPDSFTPIWNAISNLKKTNEYYTLNKKIGIFLYMPGMGFGDDGINKHKDEWRWFIVMHK